MANWKNEAIHARWPRSLFLVVFFLSFFVYMAACKSKVPGVTEDGGIGQHRLPGISNFSVDYNSSEKRLRIFYDISDSGEGRLSVQVYYCSGNDNHLTSFDAPAIGDVGDSVSPGIGKKIEIPFDPGLGVDSIKVALLTDDEKVFAVADHSGEVDTTSLKRNLEGIYGLRNYISDPGHLAMVKMQLKDSLLKYGFDVALQSFMYRGYKAENIIGRKPGLSKQRKRRKVLLCAHYDTVIDSPGADDNGSGVAVLLEIARIAANLPTEDELEIVFFDLEEPGMIGSRAYLSLGDTAGNEDIGAVMVLDMVGYASSAPHSQLVPEFISSAFPDLKKKVEANDGKGDFVICIANEHSRPLNDEFSYEMAVKVPQRKVISILPPGNGQLVPSLRRSDHSSFWDKNYPAIFIGDGADSRNPNYHSAGDKEETLDYAFMKDCAEGVLAFILSECRTGQGSMTWKTVHL